MHLTWELASAFCGFLGCTVLTLDAFRIRQRIRQLSGAADLEAFLKQNGIENLLRGRR